MSVLEFIRLVFKNLKWLIGVPLALGVLVLLLTMSMKRNYLSAGMVYTGLASGYSITSEENSRVDYQGVNNAFDNLTSTAYSRETIEETALRLLALNLSFKEPSRENISERTFDELKDILPKDLYLKCLGKHPETGYILLKDYKEASLENEITRLLNANGTYYSINSIRSALKATRKNSSDMMEFVFHSEDPAITKHTLTILIDVFINRYKGIKGKETNNVVEWFEEQLKVVRDQLKVSENKLKKFGLENGVINFYEQSKFLTEAEMERRMSKYLAKEKLDGANKSLETIKETIDNHNSLYTLNAKLERKSELLGELKYQKTANDILGLSSSDSLHAAIKSLEEELQSSLDSMQHVLTQPATIAKVEMQRTWIEEKINADKSNSELKDINQSLRDFKDRFSEFAPLGAELTAIQREIEVAEKEFLSVLHGLNLAKLRKQNLELATNLAIVDAPFFPLKPEPSKRALTILASGFAGFMLVLGLLVALFFMDGSIRNHERLKQFTGLELLGALPDFSTLPKSVRVDELRAVLMKQVASTLNLKMLEVGKTNGGVKTVGLYSHQSDIGKTWFCCELSAFLKKGGKQVAVYVPETESVGSSTKIHCSQLGVKLKSYKVTADFSFIKSMDELIPKTEEQFDYVLFVLPNVEAHSLPVHILNSTDIGVLMVDGTRSWKDSDKHFLGLALKSLKSAPLTLLNKIDYDYLDALIGEVPKDRSKFRTLLKRMVAG